MSLISEQIDKLRTYAKDRKGELAKLINDAADTIEELSAKLHASNMERSSQYYNDGWIPCSERLPEPRVDVWVNSDIGQIRGYYEEHIGVWYAGFGQGRDYLELIVNAWMPLPEPYKPKEKNNACD